MIGAVLLAGRRNTGKLRDTSEVEWEAQIPIDGRPMGGYVLSVLRRVPDVGRVAIVGPALDEPEAAPQTVVVTPGESLVENLKRGVEALGDCTEILVATCDAPLVEPDDVSDLIAAARGAGADLGYPIVERADCERVFPGVRRTYVKVSEGRFTGGNLIYLRTEALPRIWPFLDRVYAARKKPLTLLPLFGLRVLVGMLCGGRVRIRTLEARIERLAGLRGRAVILKRPAIAVDVDKPDDLELARRVLRDRSAAATPSKGGTT